MRRLFPTSQYGFPSSSVPLGRSFLACFGWFLDFLTTRCSSSLSVEICRFLLRGMAGGRILYFLGDGRMKGADAW